MIQSKYIWKKLIKEKVDDQDIYEQINKNRDIDDHEAFFSMGIESIHSPYLFSDMNKAVLRIKEAIKKKEKILIFGDYDCDGITSVSILFRMIRSLGGQVNYLVPDRFSDGYGLNIALAKRIVASDNSLVITVDNGIASVDEVNFIQNNGTDVIITDHHEFKDEIPKAFAILHTKLSSKYPFKEIAGCMVAFKLAWALNGDFPEELTDLAMIGTIADLMPLEDENQAMVNIGLKQLKKTSNLGLSKILTYSNLDIINQTSIAFQIAPKINSSGRLNKAGLAIDLLTTNDIKEANALILDIEENHVLRKGHTERSFEIAEKLIDHKDQILVLASERFHEGVIGICAQRISEKYQKPTIVLNIENDLAKGSARSFGQISILDLLNQSSKYLLRYGGHAQAAGMQLQAKDIHLFRKHLNQINIDEAEPLLNIDMEIDVHKVKKETIQKLQEKSFHTALFLMKNLRVIKKQIIGKDHVKLTLESDNKLFDAIKFNNLEYYYNISENDIIDVCGGLNINRFRNQESIQIMITDLRCRHLQVIDYRHEFNKKDVEDKLLNNFIILDDAIILESSNIKDLFLSNQSFVLFPKNLNINFNQIIDRNELIKIYFKLKKLSQFTKFDIINLLDMPEWMVNQIINIFIELNLLFQSGDRFDIKEKAKTDLKLSATYNSIIEKKKVIDWLYQSTVDKIRSHLEEKNGL